MRDLTPYFLQLTDLLTGQPTTASYDALYRLKTISYPTGSFPAEAYTYDKVGNRLTQVTGTGVAAVTRYYAYLANSNRLAAVKTGSPTGPTESSFTYDDEGRMTSQTSSLPGQTKTITWTQKGQAKTISPAGKPASTYGYDPMDLKVARTGGAGNRDYYLEGEHLEAEYSGANLQARYFRGSSTDELLASWVLDASGKDTPSIYLHDHLNSVTATTQADGTPSQIQRFSAFGQQQTLPGTTSANTTNRLKYTGRELDDDSGLYYYRARWYDPSTGRFISEDPIGFQGGINLYAYVGNNPLNANDPSGNQSVGITGMLVGAAVGAVASAGVQLYQNGGDTSKINMSNVGWSAATGGVAGILLTTPYGQTLAGVAAIGAATNTINYLLTTTSDNYSWQGAGIGAASGAFGGLLAGKAPNPYTFIKPSPMLNDFALITRMVAPKVLTMGTVGAAVGSFDFLKSQSTQPAPATPQFGAGLNNGGSFIDGVNFNPASMFSNPFSDGRFIIYPNKPNTNASSIIYNK
jgi:RHS repeat-associated protein